TGHLHSFPTRRSSDLSPKSVKLPDVQIPRVIRLKYDPFLRHFKGFEKIPAVRAIFGARTDEALRKLKVEFFSSRWGFMGVSDERSEEHTSELQSRGQL